MKASNGVATFSGLTLNKVGTGYTLQLTSSGLTTAVTSAITVTKNASRMWFSHRRVGTGPPDRSLAPLVLDSLDVPGSWATRKRTAWLNCSERGAVILEFSMALRDFGRARLPPSRQWHSARQEARPPGIARHYG